MSALSRHFERWGEPRRWQPDVAQVLDEHHVAASSAHPHHRVRFADEVAGFLAGIRDAEVVRLPGRAITDLDSFCRSLERALPGPIDRRIDGRYGVAATLRERVHVRGVRPAKFRFYVWEDADTLLCADPELFGRLVDALAGVAAEAEYVCDDLLLIHRGVFVGGPVLDAYAHHEAGQFRTWYDDGLGDPFWRVVTGVEHPPVERLTIDRLGGFG